MLRKLDVFWSYYFVIVLVLPWTAYHRWRKLKIGNRKVIYQIKSLVKLQLELHFLCLGNIPTKIDRVLVCDRWCMYRWGNTTSRNAAVTGSSEYRSSPPGLFLSISVIGRNKKFKPKRLFIRNRKYRKAYTAQYQTVAGLKIFDF